MTHAETDRRVHSVPPIAPLFSRVNLFVDLVWTCDERRICMSFGCGECGALAFRRHLAGIAAAGGAPNELAAALATVDFALLRLAPHWYDALDIALFELRAHHGGEHQLAHVVGAWLARDDIPLRVLDLVMFRHARYGHPGDAFAELWTQRCLDTAACTMDEGLVETLILACPERVGAHPQAYLAALEAARWSACVRSLINRLPGTQGTGARLPSVA